MSKEAKSCYLKSQDKSLLTVYLPDKKPIFVGRCVETNIIDTQCSREQVKLCANYAEYKVVIEQVGKRESGFNKNKTSRDVKFIGRHDDLLEIMYGKYPYQIEFNPPPLKTSSLLSKKRQLGSEMYDPVDNTPKMMKLELHDSNDDGDERNNMDSIAGGSNNEDNVATTAAKWDIHDGGALLIYTSSNVEGRSKIAAYDMDGTIIKTKSGSVFPKNYNDWQLMYPDVPGKLKKLHRDAYKIVIFTNQAGIGAGRINRNDFQSKIMKIQQSLNVPMQVFVATSTNIYRKPSTGMWRVLEEQKNNGVRINKQNSFFVGDAAGRPKNWAPGRKKDHSSVDRLMAVNLNLHFQTPEEHFMGFKQAPFNLPVFNPKNILTRSEISIAGDVVAKDQEVILMIGCPGSGKSYFAKHYLKEYGYVNRDTLGNWKKCVDAIDAHLKERNSVVVDNTNGERQSRERYINVAKKHNIPVRCFLMSTSTVHAKHNNKFRELTDPSHAKIGDVTINYYLKNYQPPSLEEGFKEIVNINFIPRFRTEEERKLYETYLLEN